MQVLPLFRDVEEFQMKADYAYLIIYSAGALVLCGILNVLKQNVDKLWAKGKEAYKKRKRNKLLETFKKLGDKDRDEWLAVHMPHILERKTDAAIA